MLETKNPISLYHYWVFCLAYLVKFWTLLVQYSLNYAAMDKENNIKEKIMYGKKIDELLLEIERRKHDQQ